MLTQKKPMRKIIESLRDWGRDCWCVPGAENTCNRRFDWQLGDLPYGYDHKYTYSHIGYNLKMTDMQAAVGVAQLAKLPSFIERRRANWQRLRDGLAASRRALRAAGRHPELAAELVRVPADGSRRPRPSTVSTSSPTSRSAGSRPGCSSAETCCASRRTPASPAAWSATSRTPT